MRFQASASYEWFCDVTSKGEGGTAGKQARNGARCCDVNHACSSCARPQKGAGKCAWLARGIGRYGLGWAGMGWDGGTVPRRASRNGGHRVTGVPDQRSRWCLSACTGVSTFPENEKCANGRAGSVRVPYLRGANDFATGVPRERSERTHERLLPPACCRGYNAVYGRLPRFQPTRRTQSLASEPSLA